MHVLIVEDEKKMAELLKRAWRKRTIPSAWRMTAATLSKWPRLSSTTRSCWT